MTQLGVWLKYSHLRDLVLYFSYTVIVHVHASILTLAIMQFPNLVEAAVMVNSEITTDDLSIVGIVRDAYDEAWS